MSLTKQQLASITIDNISGENLPLGNEQITNIVDIFINREQVGLDMLEIVFVGNSDIVQINREYLGRDYVTDIITFSYNALDSEQQFPDPERESENSLRDEHFIEGTMYCCAPRIFEQAGDLNEDSSREFSRIIIHGLLHLLQFDDSTDEQKQIMRSKEDEYLDIINRYQN